MKLTPAAVEKAKQLNKKNELLRVGVMGGGCSGFQYLMEFTNEKQMLDQTLPYEGLTVIMDSTSATYLNDAELDYVDTLEESGFKFNNPNVKTTCGCGKSFGA